MPTINALGRAALLATTVLVAQAASAHITLFENDGYGGRTLDLQRTTPNLAQRGFNDRASSVIVTDERWEVCQDAGFNGRCVVLRPGSYASLGAMGLNDRLSSARPLGLRVSVDESRYAPAPLVEQDFRRRNGERIFQADVKEVRAVVAQPEQRCWIEREEVSRDDGGRPNVGAAIAGAVLGGVLGHQVGGGTGKDLATAGGAVGGALLGSRVGSSGSRTDSRDVQRCAPVAGAPRKADYWDVTYVFRGREHHVQMTSPPGATVPVNRDGEPRV